MTKRRLLWVGDAGVSTGFARATHKVCDWLHASGEWDVDVLGIGYKPEKATAARHPYYIHPAKTEDWEDPFGIRRLREVCELVVPDVVVILQDPWFIQLYREALGNTPLVAWLAVDGKNLRAEDYLSGVTRCVFWTDFALEEARAGGLTGPASVVPLGVDLELYRQLPKAEARRAWNLQRASDGYVIGNVNRNQPRKRMDLTIRAFAKWVLEHDIPDAYLMLHVAPTGEHAIDIKQLIGYYGLSHRLILSVPPNNRHGTAEAQLAGMYSCFDAMLTTTQGEGFGLTTFEGMAAGVPQIVPDWSALGELCAGAARLVRCTGTYVTIGSRFAYNVLNPNVLGGIPDEEDTVAALHELYSSAELRAELAEKGRARVAEDRFRWDNIGEAFHRELEAALMPSSIERQEERAGSAAGQRG